MTVPIVGLRREILKLLVRTRAIAVAPRPGAQDLETRLPGLGYTAQVSRLTALLNECLRWALEVEADPTTRPLLQTTPELLANVLRCPEHRDIQTISAEASLLHRRVERLARSSG